MKWKSWTHIFVSLILLKLMKLFVLFYSHAKLTQKLMRLTEKINLYCLSCCLKIGQLFRLKSRKLVSFLSTIVQWHERSAVKKFEEIFLPLPMKNYLCLFYLLLHLFLAMIWKMAIPLARKIIPSLLWIGLSICYCGTLLEHFIRWNQQVDIWNPKSWC